MQKGPYSLKDFSSVYLGNVVVGQDLSHAPDFLRDQLVSAGFAVYKADLSANVKTYQTKVVNETPSFLVKEEEQPTKSSLLSPVAQVLNDQTSNISKNGAKTKKKYAK